MLKEEGHREGYLMRSQLAGLWYVVTLPIGVRDEAPASGRGFRLPQTGCGAFSA